MPKLLSVKPQAKKIAHELWKGKSEINLEDTVKQIQILRVKDNINGFLAGVAVTSAAIGLMIVKSNH